MEPRAMRRWWYKLVCKRWRILQVILGSASYLGLCLACTRGTPVADMLAHSPPFPLVLDYFHVYRGIDVEDEEAIILALKQRGRIRRVRLRMIVRYMLKLITAIDKEYPVLEYLRLGTETTVWDRVRSLCFLKRFKHHVYRTTSPPAVRLCPSDGIAIIHDCRWPRQARS